MDLHGLVGDPHRRFRRGELGHRRLGAEAAAVLLGFALGPGRAQGQQGRRIQLALHVGDLGLGHLERADRCAEGLAVARPLQGGLVRGTGDADRLRGDADASGIEHAHRDREALAFFAQQVFLRQHVVGELDLAGGRGADAELRLGLAGVEARQLGVDDEGRHALGADARRGDREQHDVARHRTGGDPALLAVDDPVAVRVPGGTGVHGRGIGARLRLGQCIGTDRLAGGDGAHVLLLLFLGAVLEDAVAEQRIVHRHDGRRGRVGGRDLDHRQHVGDRVHAGTAVRLRHLDAHQSEPAHLADVLQRKLALRIQLGRHRRNALLREITGDRLDRQLVFGKTEIHGRAP